MPVSPLFAASKQLHRLCTESSAKLRQDGAALTVEAHILHRFSSSFYGEPLRVIATAFLR